MDERKNNPFGVEYISCSVALIKQYKLGPAALYGLIWSKCQLAHKRCHASETQLGKELGDISRQTVSKYIKILEDAGFIKVISRGNYYGKADENNENNKRTNFSGLVLHIVCNHENVLLFNEMMKPAIKQMRDPYFDGEDIEIYPSIIIPDTDESTWDEE